MEQQRSLFFTASVGLIILAIIVGSIYYLVKFIQARVASSRQPQASVETIVQASGSPLGGSVQGEQSALGSDNIVQAPVQTGQGNPAQNSKVLNSGNFQLSYPKNWGLLTCTNSKNFEFDPSNPADTKVSCEFALKPVTVIVDEINGCEGQTIKLGNIETIKEKKTAGDYTSYKWCTKTTPVLNITHRVSKGGEKASSPLDYSSQIEDIITRLTFVRGS